MTGSNTADACQQLLQHSRTTWLLASSAAVLGWDQEVMLPPGGVAHRAAQLALLASLCHSRTLDPRVEEWLQVCEQDPALRADPDGDFASNVRELRRDRDRAARLPAALVAELAEVESLSQHHWAKARAAADYRAFQPWLGRMLELQRQKAASLRQPQHGEAWDALLDLHEPGATAAQIGRLFAGLTGRLRPLIDRALGGSNGGADPFQGQSLPQPAQEAFVREVLAAIGFDLQRGRLDRSTHPFCTGTGGDVRLTTRYTDDGVLDALGSTMHEGGHGLYEQGLEPDHLGTPLGEAVSLGIHESQSRLWENHVGRSAAFWRWATPVLQRHLPAAAGLTAHQLFLASNRVQPSLIRVEADEATYDLHILVRFELERALFAGDLPLPDLPAAWNAAYRQHLGVSVPDDARGCLQDVHWSCGLFGYFPTYTLGNLYAAQFMAAAVRALGDVDGMIGRGEFAPLRQWLRQNVHRHGRRHLPGELCRRATGAGLDPEPFLTHLAARIAAVRS